MKKYTKKELSAIVQIAHNGLERFCKIYVKEREGNTVNCGKCPFASKDEMDCAAIHEEFNFKNDTRFGNVKRRDPQQDARLIIQELVERKNMKKNLEWIKTL